MLAECLNNDQWFALVGFIIAAFFVGIKLGYKWGKNDGFAKGYIRGMNLGKLRGADSK